MSKGIGGSARVVMQDENTVVYEYYAYNLNDEECLNPEHIYDGIIIVDKHSLVEPEIHEKLKKQPSGRKKLITKRIPLEVDYSGLIATGKISVKNSKFCWRTLDNGIWLIAILIYTKAKARYPKLWDIMYNSEISHTFLLFLPAFTHLFVGLLQKIQANRVVL